MKTHPSITILLVVLSFFSIIFSTVTLTLAMGFSAMVLGATDDTKTGGGSAMLVKDHDALDNNCATKVARANDNSRSQALHNAKVGSE